jgi:hypothetical protein
MMPITINDRRSNTATPWAYVVFRDSFMSGWGQAPRRSLYALAVANPKEASAVLAQGKRRSEMRDGRIIDAGLDGLPAVQLHEGDHLSIADQSCAQRWYSTDPADSFGAAS